ncbi:hypothetical protein I79_017971 [Cricetulus griseus]|uniref:Uncharacterized protein n=1 Tax=Cricetulus griseus TaxID=10029 RepID=G3I3G5_CRIGR|nr:hypothetical protein I79_017971 [Cricetulus griseus]
MSPSRVLRSLSARLLLSESSRVLPDGRIGPRPRSDARSTARREERRWREGAAKRLLGLWRTQRQNGGRSARERLLQGALVSSSSDAVSPQWAVLCSVLPSYIPDDCI